MLQDTVLSGKDAKNAVTLFLISLSHSMWQINQNSYGIPQKDKRASSQPRLWSIDCRGIDIQRNDAAPN